MNFDHFPTHQLRTFSIALIAILIVSVRVDAQSSSKSKSAGSLGSTVENQPASIREAAAVLDLRVLELPDDVTILDHQVSALTCQMDGDPKTVYRFLQAQLVKSGWKELPGSMMESTYANGMFSKSGFTLNCSSSPVTRDNGTAAVFVSLQNFGNVTLKSLPVPMGAKEVFVNEATAMYVTDASVAKTVDECLSLLKKAGWESYGRNDVSADQIHFAVRQNAVQITSMVSLAADNRTSLMYSAQLLSAELPAPENAEQLNFTSSQKTLRFQSADDYEAVAAFYLSRLKSEGWKSTTEKLIVSDNEFGKPVGYLAFRNEQKDLISLDLTTVEDKTDATVVHLTEQEINDAEKRSREAAEKLLAERDADEKQAAADRKEAEMKFAADDAAIDGLASSLIAEALGGAKKKSSDKTRPKSSAKATPIRIKTGTALELTSDNVLKVTADPGTGKATAEFIAGHLKADGWKAADDDLDKTSGTIEFSRKSQRITLTYVDTGITDVTLMLIGIGTDLSVEETDEAAK